MGATAAVVLRNKSKMAGRGNAVDIIIKLLINTIYVLISGYVALGIKCFQKVVSYIVIL